MGLVALGGCGCGCGSGVDGGLCGRVIVLEMGGMFLIGDNVLLRYVLLSI